MVAILILTHTHRAPETINTTQHTSNYITNNESPTVDGCNIDNIAHTPHAHADKTPSPIQFNEEKIEYEDMNGTEYPSKNQNEGQIIPLEDKFDTNWLQKIFSMQDLDHAWKRMKEMKAMGPDNLPNRMLMEGYSVTRHVLLQLFNINWLNEYTPVTWRQATYNPKLKPNSIDSDPQRYRPLTLSTQLGRIYSSIPADRLLTHCSTHEDYNLKYWSNAFQPNKSIEDIGTNITQDGYYALHTRDAVK